MPPTCKVCAHPDREQIDRALADRETMREIGKRFGPSTAAIHRHARTCVSRQITQADRAKAMKAIDHAEWLVLKLRMIAENCEVAPRQFLLAADTLNRSLLTLGRLTGEIQSSSTQVINLFASLGVKDESEIRRALELTRSGDEVSLDDCFEESLALLQFCLRERPELRHSALRRLDVSHAEVLENPESGSVGNRAPGEAGGDAMGLRP